MTGAEDGKVLLRLLPGDVRTVRVRTTSGAVVPGAAVAFSVGEGTVGVTDDRGEVPVPLPVEDSTALAVFTADGRMTRQVLEWGNVLP